MSVSLSSYQCSICGYVYRFEDGDPDNGVMPGTSFDALPTEWHCPICGAEHHKFQPVK